MSGTQLFSGPSKKKAAATNPFARALAETEKSTYGQQASQPGLNPFAEAMTRTGGQFPSTPDADFFEQQQLEAAEKQKKEALRRKLHDQVNPVDMVDVYNARQSKVKEEIDKLRQELKLLALDISKFQKQVDITLMSEVVNPGQDGKYYISFFQQLRSFIMLLRQKIKSASTWATQMHSKKSKKKQRGGLMIQGQGHEKTSAVQNMMHHERSNAYAGG